ncbi:MAG: hypothetical protein OXU30_00835, partial [Gammaproteobacteria bacterium]|nr:hypothetical protein [Gammaproteobacteria bacterium]
MEHQEYLRTISEVAITLTGFMGIVAAIKIDVSEWSVQTIAQFSTLLRASISASLLAFVPYLLFQFIGDENLTWRISAALFAVVMATNLFLFLRDSGGNYASLIQRLMFLVGPVILAAVLLSVFTEIDSGAMFLVGVTWQIIVGLNNFALLL